MRGLSFRCGGGALAFALPALLSVGCRDKATQACQEELTNAQPVVSHVDGKSNDSVSTALTAVQRALAACRAAGRSEESEQLARAESELKTQLQAIARRGDRKKRAKPSAADVEELVKKGDDSCPRGMAYKAENSDRQIKCTGPQPVRMNYATARDYYSGSGYKVTPSESPPELRVEYGAELMVFSYARPNDSNPPKCLTLYPLPDMPWQEAVARATGAQLPKIKRDLPVPLSGGDVPLTIEESKDKLVIRLGACG
jgi:hypothetical protein